MLQGKQSRKKDLLLRNVIVDNVNTVSEMKLQISQFQNNTLVILLAAENSYARTRT